MTSSQTKSEELLNISEEVLSEEVTVAPYFEGKAETQSSSSTTYVDSEHGSGEILPWGVKAVGMARI